MASPFSIFRKHQQILMVVLVVGAMFAFTLDSLFSAQGRNLVLLGVLAGAGIALIAGIQFQRPMRYAAGGAVLGALAGWGLPMFVGEAGAVDSSIGSFTEERVDEMIERRRVASNFVVRLRQRALPFNLGGDPFRLVYPNPAQDVILGELLRAEAGEIGIYIDDNAVNDYIEEMTFSLLKEQDFKEVKKDTFLGGKRVSETQLYDVLREQLTATMALRTLVPFRDSDAMTPEMYWELFRKMNVRQRVSAVPIPVDDFLATAGQPTQEELDKLYRDNRTKFRNQDEPGSPGFFQPKRVRLAFLEADYETIEGSVPPVTDDDIQKYYDENKDLLFTKPPELPDTPDVPATPDGTAPTPGAPTEGDPNTPDAGASDPEAGAAGENTTEKAGDDTTGGDDAASGNAGDGDSDDTSEGDNSGDDTSGDDTSGDDTSGDDTSGDDPNGDGCDPAAQDDAAQDPAANSGLPDGTQDAAKQDTNPPSLTIPPPQSDDTTGDASSQAGATDDADGQTPGQAGKAEAGGADPFENQKVEYRPLDADLRQQLRDTLLHRRVADQMDKILQEVLLQMHDLGERIPVVDPETGKPLALPGQDEQLKYSEVRRRLQELAAKHGLEYAETPLVAYQDLSNGEEFPIGSATEPVPDQPLAPGQPRPQPATVSQLIFGVEDSILFTPARAEAVGFDFTRSSNQFAYWVIAQNPAHAPAEDPVEAFREPGLREQVVEAWKRERARPQATKRAEEIRDLVTAAVKDGKTMTDAIQDLTITGENDSPLLEVTSTLPFSWLRVTSAASPTGQPQQQSASLSEVDGLDGVDNDFMDYIFNTLSDNEVGVVPNADRSIVYIVQAINRFPSDEADEDSLRQRFLSTPHFSSGPMPRLVRQQYGEDNLAWLRRLEKKYRLNWPGQTPDA